ncbi:MAG TPA: hypothetical protein VG488_11670, partial [Candidatus Angelobacter sp.]|nr:hypothetical protein [Candidatus Angelobacter sp.]
MTKKLLMTLMTLTLATGIAFAQTGSGSTGSQNPQTPSSTTASPSSSESTVRGCLKQSGSDWILSQSGAGQDITLKGDSSMLKPHDGHQVEVKGTQADNNTLQVSSVSMISDSCG